MSDWIGGLNDRQRIAAVVSVVLLAAALSMALLPYEIPVGEATVACPAPLLDVLGATAPGEGRVIRPRSHCTPASRLWSSVLLGAIVAAAGWTTVRLLDRGGARTGD